MLSTVSATLKKTWINSTGSYHFFDLNRVESHFNDHQTKFRPVLDELVNNPTSTLHFEEVIKKSTCRIKNQINALNIVETSFTTNYIAQILLMMSLRRLLKQRQH